MNRKNGKLPSKDIRAIFLQKGSAIELNTYFKKLENLANRDDYYNNIYQEDREFIINQKDDGINMLHKLMRSSYGKSDNNNNNNYQTAGFLDCIFGSKKPDPNSDLLKYISNAQPNTYCAVSTQKNQSCENKMEKNIVNILKTLEEGVDTVYKKGEITRWKQAIREFIEFLYCCVDLYTSINFKEYRETIILPIIDKIINNDNYLAYANGTIRIMNYNETNKILNDYLTHLREKYEAQKVHNHDKVKQLDKIEEEVFKKKGFGLTYLTKIISKMMNKEVIRTEFDL